MAFVEGSVFVLQQQPSMHKQQNTSRQNRSRAQSPLNDSTYLSQNSLFRISDLPVHCSPETSILDASLLMKSKSTHCLLIIEQVSGKLIGLTTTKDVAFKAVAKSLDPETPISQIMTKTPYYVSHLTSPNDALKLMVDNKIRHMPIVNENESVIGILNITTCFYNAMIRLEKLNEKAKKLESTFNELNENTNTHLFNNDKSVKLKKITSNDMNVIPSIKIRDHQNHLLNTKKMELNSLDEDLLDLDIITKRKKIINDLKNLISIMKQPNLKSLLNNDQMQIKKPFVIPSNSSIFESSQLLLFNNLTSALVVHSNNDPINNGSQIHVEDVIGIITTKDLVYRALACRIDLKSSTVVRIMTPKPDIANESMPINHALRLMYEGKYLNLPITDSNDNVIALINVLNLTYALIKILNQSSLHSEHNTVKNDGKDSFDSNSFQLSTKQHNNIPAWNKFWDSLDRPLNNPLSNSSTSLSTLAKRSLSVVDTPKYLKASTTDSKRSSSFTNIPANTTFNAMNNSMNSYVNIKAVDDSDSEYCLFGKNVKSLYSVDGSFSNFDNKYLKQLSIKLKVTEVDDLSLGFDKKTYIFELDSDVDNLYDSLMSLINRRLNISKTGNNIVVQIGFFDNENDFITVESTDDIRAALKQSDTADRIILHARMRRNQKSKKFNTSFLLITETFKKSLEWLGSMYRNDKIIFGGVGVFLLMVSKFIVFDKRT